MATTPNKIEVMVKVMTSPADVLDQVAKQFSEAADQWRSLADKTREDHRTFDAAMDKVVALSPTDRQLLRDLNHPRWIGRDSK